LSIKQGFIEKITSKKGESLALVVELLPSKFKVLSSNTSIAQRKKKKGGLEKEMTTSIFFSKIFVS
jgi:hypothetical protein